MVASITTTSAVTMPEVASVTTAPEASTPLQAAPPTTQTAKQPISSTQQPATKDTVELSSTSLALSKALNEQQQQAQTPTAAAINTPEAQPKSSAPTQEEAKPELLLAKHFPPFLGNSNELKALKQYSPALYREILRMIVPPPLDLTYSDQQILQGFTARKASRTP